MKYLRKWILSTLIIHRHEPDEHPENWGKSVFWYCHHCGHQYAYSELYDEEANRRPFVAVAGTCPHCPSNKYSLAGGIEGAVTIGWHVDHEVAWYQLEIELMFLEHPDHPYNKEIVDG